MAPIRVLSPVSLLAPPAMCRALAEDDATEVPVDFLDNADEAFDKAFDSSNARASDSESVAAAATDAHSLTNTDDFLCCATEAAAAR